MKITQVSASEGLWGWGEMQSGSSEGQMQASSQEDAHGADDSDDAGERGCWGPCWVILGVSLKLSSLSWEIK